MATTAKDIILDENNELCIVNGDLLVAESDGQHIQDILSAAPGHYKQSPLIGANVTSQKNGVANGEFRRTVRLQLESDGYSVGDLKFDQQNIIIDAERK